MISPGDGDNVASLEAVEISKRITVIATMLCKIYSIISDINYQINNVEFI
jgi:hypothetical protein